MKEMADQGEVIRLQQEFRSVHEVLRRGGAARAADAILEYVGVEPVAPSPTAAPGSRSAGGADGAFPDAGGTPAGAISRDTHASIDSPRDTPRK
jgi:hypothetical protein